MRLAAIVTASVLGLAMAGQAVAEGCAYAKPQTTAQMSKPEAETAQMSKPSDAAKVTAEAATDEATKPVETAAAPAAETTVKPN